MKRMKTDDIRRNASGYYDETAFKAIQAITKAPKAGEIWMDSTGSKTYLVLQSRKSVCSTLLLGTENKENSIVVMARVPMYTDPIMIGYTFSSMLTQYVKTVTEDSMETVKKAVARALGIHAEPECEDIQKSFDAVCKLNKELKAQLDSAMIYKELYTNMVDKLVAARGGATDD